MSRQSTGYVYFVQAPINGLIKIGYSRESPDSRLAAFRQGSPVSIERLGIIRAGIQFESKLHRRFAHLSAHGEWFQPGADLLDFVRDWAWPWTCEVSLDELSRIPPRHHREAIDAGSPWLDPLDVKKAEDLRRRAERRQEYQERLLDQRVQYIKEHRDPTPIHERLARIGYRGYWTRGSSFP